MPYYRSFVSLPFDIVAIASYKISTKKYLHTKRSSRKRDVLQFEECSEISHFRESKHKKQNIFLSILSSALPMHIAPPFLSLSLKSGYENAFFLNGQIQ
jgi:hypothetical protein